MISHDEFVVRLHNINPNINALEKYTKSHNKIKVKCLICDFVWDALPTNLLRGHGCNNCASIKLSKLFKKSQNQFELEVQNLTNGNISVISEYKNITERINFHCNICGQEFNRLPHNFLSSPKCPVCDGTECANGINDLWETNPEIASMLLNADDGYKYTIRNRKVKLDWKCSCGNIIKSRTLNYVLLNGLACKKCCDGLSYPNKFMFNVLSQLSIEFEAEKSFSWSDDRKYDNYIPFINCIIENHGIGHYEIQIHKKGKTVEQEQQNDTYKKQLAIANNIEEYITIDARYSELAWIKQSILNSRLAELFDLSNIDWVECHKYATKSIIYHICELWKHHNQIGEISKQLKLHTCTVSGYLKTGNKLGLCDYSPDKNRSNSTFYYKSKPILCVTTNEKFRSIKEAMLKHHLGHKKIVDCCNGAIQFAGHSESGEKLQWKYVS